MRLRCGRRKNNMKNQIIIDKKEEHLYSGTIERIERKSRLARRVGECPAGEIVQIFSKSFIFISRQNDSNPINPLNQLNHPKGVCFYINKFLRND